MFQQILSCLRLQKAEQEVLRDFPSVKPRLTAIEHCGCEVRVADAQPLRFFEEDESNQLLPVGRKTFAVAKTNEEQPSGGDGTRLGYDQKGLAKSSGKHVALTNLAQKTPEVLINFPE